MCILIHGVSWICEKMLKLCCGFLGFLEVTGPSWKWKWWAVFSEPRSREQNVVFLHSRELMASKLLGLGASPLKQNSHLSLRIQQPLPLHSLKLIIQVPSHFTHLFCLYHFCYAWFGLRFCYFAFMKCYFSSLLVYETGSIMREKSLVVVFVVLLAVLSNIPSWRNLIAAWPISRHNSS